MTIKFKITFVLISCFTIIVALGYLGYQSYREAKIIHQTLSESSEIRGTLIAIANSPFYSSLRNRLQRYEGTLVPDYRNQSLKKIINYHKLNNRRLLNSEISNFRKQEIRFVAYTKENLQIYESRLQTICLAFGITVFFSLLLIYRIVSKSVFKPLKHLSKRMVDFLNNRYTYQFRLPKKNEVGELELNFHSLAQRVLNNIEELKALDSAKSDFLNIASHELRTPLTSIKGSLSLLKTGITKLPPDKVTQLFAIAENETDRLIRLINDLLDLAKIESGKLPLEQNWIPIDSLIEKTLYSLEGISKTANVSLSYNKGQYKLAYIDEDKVQQVLTNLVSNAVKYSPEEGTVFIIVDIDHSNHLRISVQDQGKGISPNDQKLIFEKFRQATGPTNPIVKGTGLGLAIAKAVIEEHGGIISVNSQVNKGSTFYFTLPEWKQDAITIDFKTQKEQADDLQSNKKVAI